MEERLPRSVYFLGSRKEEPINYNYLHEKSVLRAVVSYLQSENTSDGKSLCNFEGLASNTESCLYPLMSKFNSLHLLSTVKPELTATSE